MRISSHEIEPVTGYTAEAIRNLYRRGILQPTFGHRGRAGVPHTFSLTEAAYLALLNRLAARRSSLQVSMGVLGHMWPTIAEWWRKPTAFELWAVVARGETEEFILPAKLPNLDDVTDPEAVNRFWYEYAKAHNEAASELGEPVMSFEAINVSGVIVRAAEKFKARAKSDDDKPAEPVIKERVNA